MCKKEPFYLIILENRNGLTRVIGGTNGVMQHIKLRGKFLLLNFCRFTC